MSTVYMYRTQKHSIMAGYKDIIIIVIIEITRTTFNNNNNRVHAFVK